MSGLLFIAAVDGKVLQRDTVCIGTNDWKKYFLKVKATRFDLSGLPGQSRNSCGRSSANVPARLAGIRKHMARTESLERLSTFLLPTGIE
jgi:hypothetical protein